MDDNSNSKVVGKLNEKEGNCSTLSGSVKRSRTPNSGIHVASCLVDGCNSDLRKCRDYHRRHKVCELHSKTPKVIVRGQEQRFCQQCSRFHSLEEFDEGKRSCRKRLDGHNRRRRKPQPEPLHLTSAGFLAQYEGTRFLAFNRPQILPTSPILSYGTHHHHHHVPFKFDTRNDSIGHDATTKRHSSFESTIFHGSYSPSATELNFTSENASSSSNRARSLLSSSPETPEDDEGLRHMMMMHPNAMITQPHHLHHLDALGIHNNTNLNICHHQSMFDTNIVSDGSSSSVHHKLFSWE